AINIAVVTASMPTTGLPLPFVSYGGTSLVVNMAAAGILINMSRRRVFETVGAQSRESRRGKRS
ncbi:FtsW/RodA/SpoVE family cell cycle protein, partial [bacterium]|nr:FtsW/RodA/SpoVE family cell cycle protein [bacterium]